MDALERLNNELGAMLLKSNTRSVSAGILYRGERYFLCAGPDRVGAPVSSRTVYGIGSVTRAFTAELFCLLEREGVLCLDTPVSTMLPGLVFADLETTENLTLRHILSQRSGVADHWCAFYAFPDDTEEVRFRKFSLCKNEPVGSRMRGCPSLGAVLDAVCRRATGTDRRLLIKKKILEPAGMTTTYTDLQEIPEEAAQAGGFERIEGKITPVGYDHTGVLNAACGIASNAEDLLRYLEQRLVRGAVHAAGRCFDEPHALPVSENGMGIAGKKALAYGMGWYTEQYRGHENRFCAGYVDGFSSYIGLMPQDGLAVAVLCNTGHSPLTASLPYEIYDAVLGTERTDHLRAVMSWIPAHAPAGRVIPPPAEPYPEPEQLCGVYEDPLYGRLEIRLENGRPVGKYGMFTLRMDHLGGGNYVTYMVGCDRSAETHDSPFPVRFLPGKDGRAEAVMADFGEERRFVRR